MGVLSSANAIILAFSCSTLLKWRFRTDFSLRNPHLKSAKSIPVETHWILDEEGHCTETMATLHLLTMYFHQVHAICVVWRSTIGRCIACSTHQLFKANIRGPQVHEGQYDRLLSGIPTLFTSVLVA